MEGNASGVQPRNIFEQILFGQLTINNNVVALSKNIEVLNDKIEGIMSVFAAHSEVVDVAGETVLNK